METNIITFLLIGALVLLAVHRLLTRRSIKYIRGPPSPSFVFGHTVIQSRQDEVGDLDKQLIEEYGTVSRLKGCLGEEVLFVADPKALQHILHKSAYHYPKSTTGRQITRQIAGQGILYAEGQDHARNRKIMNPAFTASQLRSFLPLFRRQAAKLSQKWKDQLQTAVSESDRVINVHTWLARTTLDVIGEAAFDYECGALDDSQNPVMKAYKNMFSDSLLHPSKAITIFRSLWRFIPLSLLWFVEYLPTREDRRFRRTLNVINKLSKELIDEKTEACLAGKGENKKDIMSILVKANASEDPRMRLSDTEMVSQMATFLLAGHETTSSTLTWLLWDLAKNVEYQSKMREEIAAIRARVQERGDSDFTIMDLDAMTHVLAAMKEGLRMNPIAYNLTRTAERDDMVPLAIPITLADGEVLDEVPVAKGTTLIISIWGYNRLPQVWGPDANEFKPERWFELDKAGQTNVGVFSNLLTFSGGLRGCIGWRFSIIEMQAILVELIENFEFSIPSDKPDIRRVPAGLTIPMIRGKMHLGSQMPLQVSPVN